MRYTPALGMSLLLGGCSLISSFDFSYRDGGASMDAGARDAGARDAGARDAGARDASPADAEVDAGVGVDAGPMAPRCPAPCFGDAAEDYVPDTQGNGALDWRYHRDTGESLGLDFPELDWGSFGELSGFGWAADRGEVPVIASCSDNGSARACAGLSDHLVVVSGSAESGRAPALSFRAANRGVLRIQGRFRIPDGFTGGNTHEISISRNARNDVAATTSFVPTTTPTEFDELVDVLPGDHIIVRFAQRSGTATPLGVQLWVTGMGAPVDDRCLMGITFDAPTPLRDQCGELDVADIEIGPGTPLGPSAIVPGVSPWLGDGRGFLPGQYMRVGRASMDYSGDFTVQVWGYTEPDAMFAQVFYADSTQESPPGGVYIANSDSRVYTRTFHRIGAEPCTESIPGVCIVADSVGGVALGEWHFYRIVRSVERNEMVLCIDGQEQIRLSVDGGLDLTGAYPPYLARNVIFNPAYLDGRLDDVRVYDVALPCEP